MIASPPRLLAALLVVVAGSHAPGAAQGRSGVPREEMWPAPTAQDWARPCLIHWQRSFEDALAVARETGKPILVAVNMDGEIASEHYAGVRYRDPEIAALFEPYVCVIASVYRHNPRDYDTNGRRIPCPRFGTVTCGEHIAVEPELFDRFFEGERVAPRHIMVELDGSETYDIYYALDTASVFRAIREGVAGRPPARPVARADRSILERARSADAADREAVERAWVEGDADLRRAILAATAAQGSRASVDLLRLAIFGLDVDLAGQARRALARVRSEKGAVLMAEALRVPMPAVEREGILQALEAIGERSPWARSLAQAQRGLDGGEGALDPEAWARAQDGLEVPGREEVELASGLERWAAASAARPDDAGARLTLAEAFLARAAEAPAREAELLLLDAERELEAAVERGAQGWRVEATRAIAASARGDDGQARARAEAAVAAMPPGAYGWSAMAVLVIFADARRQAIADAVRRKEPWPREWFADVHGAYEALARHPLGTDAQVVQHYEFLRRLGAIAPAGAVLRRGLQRFPDSGELHACLRGRILWEQGAPELERTYERMLLDPGASPNLEWFAGLASIVAAESERRSGRGPNADAAYRRGIEHFERAIARVPSCRDSADHYVAMARAGRARLAYERGDWDAALEAILQALRRRPASAASLDGLGISPVGTAQMLLARLGQLDRTEQAERLRAALEDLDPSLLRLPAFERGGAPSPDARRAARGRRGG